jgi:hypothetical protein
MIQIRPGTDADRPQILARLAEVFGPESAARAERLWDWQWHRDPRLATPGYRGLVAEWRGQILGNLATIPAGLHIDGDPAEAFWCTDVLVHWGLAKAALRAQRRTAIPGGPDLARGVAAALLDHPAAGPIQLAKHISDPMMTILERIEFTAMADSGSLHRRVSLRHRLVQAFGAKTGDALGAAADLALGRIRPPGLPVEPLEGPFDRRFDDLWERSRCLFPAIGRRDAATLEWRYRQHPDGGYRVLTLGSRRGLRGYCIFLDYDRGRRRWGKIVDLIAAPGDTQGMRALLLGALGLMRRARVERAEVFGCGAGIGPVLADLGLVPRLAKSGRPQPLMVRNLPEAARGIYVTQGDGDGG